MTEKEVKELLARYRSGQCSESERQAIEDWMDQEVSSQKWDISTADKDAFGQSLKQSIDHQIVSKPVRLRLWTWVRIAAAILLFLSIGIGIYWYQMGLQPSPQITSQYGDDILPGGNRATLTLADGRSIDLSETQTGITSNDARIAYTDGIGIVDVKEVQQVTIQTPRGGTYQIVLPDGSKVWLNSESTLNYPTTFTNNERRVTLTGEAYFEVTKDTELPFVVQSGTQEVQVLGTAFNIQAYDNEPAIVTTLVKGSVRIQALPTGNAEMLEPGQQATVAGRELTISNVDAGSFTAWKDGYFQFDGVELKAVMRQLERWYGIEVDFGNMPNWKLYAKISRDNTLSTVLYAFSKTSGVEFTYKEGRLTIRK